jgi:transcriptional regulator with XRE-family HTH domain
MEKHIVNYATDDLLQALRRAREEMGFSQRELSTRTGVPQSHISKIENGATDLRLSSLVEMAHALEHEVVLVPRKLLPAVEAVVKNAPSARTGGAARQVFAVLNRVQVIKTLEHVRSDAPEVKRLRQALRELMTFPLGKVELAALHAVTDNLMKLPHDADALPAIEQASRQLMELRDKIACVLSEETPRPAYRLDDEEEGEENA